MICLELLQIIVGSQSLTSLFMLLSAAAIPRPDPHVPASHPARIPTDLPERATRQPPKAGAYSYTFRIDRSHVPTLFYPDLSYVVHLGRATHLLPSMAVRWRASLMMIAKDVDDTRWNHQRSVETQDPR
jgi:hypothetical protein